MDKLYKVIIAGSRTYNDSDFLFKKMDFLLKDKIKNGYKIVIISGTAKGADSLGEKYAYCRGFQILRFFPDWDFYGKAAGMIRNKEMAEEANACVIFFDKDISKGSEGMRNLCIKFKIPYRSYLNNKLYKYS